MKCTMINVACCVVGAVWIDCLRRDGGEQINSDKNNSVNV